MSRYDAAVEPRFVAVFYDLDGTLVDSRPGIQASLRAAFAVHASGVDPPPLDTLLGRPLAGLLRGVLPGLDRATLRPSPPPSQSTTTLRAGASAGRIRACPRSLSAWPRRVSARSS